jgi:ABC-type multidrug transport system fused ATPase/permease subunit
MAIVTEFVKPKPLLAAAGDFLRDYARYAGRKGLTAAALVLAGALLEGLGLALIVPLLGVIFDTGKTGGQIHRMAQSVFEAAGLTTPTARLSLLLGVFAVVMIVRAVVILARDLTLARLRIGFVESQRLEIAERLAGAPWDKVARLRHARITQVLSTEVQQIGIAAAFLTQSLTAAAMLLAQCVLAFWLAPPLALIAVLLLVAGGVALMPMMRYARKLGAFVSNANQDLLHSTAQLLGGLKLAISQNLQSGFLAEFRTILLAQRDRQIEYLRQQTESRLAITTVSALAGAVLVLVGVTAFHIAPPLLIALLLVVSRMSGPFGQIQQGGQLLANALPAYEKVRTLAAELADLPAEAAGAGPVAIGGPIRFDNVSYRHGAADDDSHGVMGLSLTLEPGTSLGIGGPSGAGKTTFADLLAGLYAPQSGTIWIGDQPLAGTALRAWRSRIAYVAQDPFLFHDSVRRNLAWASPGVGEAEMWRALGIAEAADFVRGLPEGLDTVVGERGTLMSGGERQRIALARAVLRRPLLMILDEATNAVDPATERTIIDRLLALTPRPAIVVIAHRKDSLVRCDRMMTMQSGRMA